MIRKEREKLFLKKRKYVEDLSDLQKSTTPWGPADNGLWPSAGLALPTPVLGGSSGPDIQICPDVPSKQDARLPWLDASTLTRPPGLGLPLGGRFPLEEAGWGGSAQLPLPRGHILQVGLSGGQHIQRSNMGISVAFSSETIGAKQQWNDSFSC